MTTEDLKKAYIAGAIKVLEDHCFDVSEHSTNRIFINCAAAGMAAVFEALAKEVLESTQKEQQLNDAMEPFNK